MSALHPAAPQPQLVLFLDAWAILKKGHRASELGHTVLKQKEKNKKAKTRQLSFRT